MPVPQPEAWKNIVGAPIHEGFVLMALSALDGLVDRHYLPTQRHVQLLLHLVTDPKVKQEDLRRVSSPLSILYRYLDLFGSDLLPLIPQLHKGATAYDNLRTPDWLAWKPNGQLERVVRKRVLDGAKHGIWVFLSEPVTKMASPKKVFKKRRRKGDEDSEDERETPSISDDGWGVLEWLVALWSKSPPSLLQQLHQPASARLQYDDAGIVFTLVRAAFLPTDPPTPPSVLFTRRETAGRLLSLLIDLARPPKSPFHTQSLVLSLVTVFRVPPTHIQALSRAIRDWNARAYILAVVLEDAAGVRKEREAARRSNVASRSTSRAPTVMTTRASGTAATRSRSTTLAIEAIPGVMSLSIPFQAPDVGYVLDLLALEGDDRSPVLAAELVSLLVSHVPQDDAWMRLDDKFIREYDGVLGRVLIMARKKADTAKGRKSTIGVTVTFTKPDEQMDVDSETQSTMPLTRSQLARFANENKAGTAPSGTSSPLSSLSASTGDGEERKESISPQPTLETVPLGSAQLAQFDDMVSGDEEEGMEESQLPPETLPLTKEQRAKFAIDDDMESAEGSQPQNEEDKSDEEELQLPAETLSLTTAQRAQYAEELDGEDEGSHIASTPAKQVSPADSGREASVSDIIGQALSPGDSVKSEGSQLQAETQQLTRSQRRALYEDEESQFS
ncbi:hypothetical protein CC85DRAFT_328069 [Cutaneotrichosporon oleaginosum]|uniref:Uncharacterized protein n=1 Tax=Cutaneotrichosporon oleaginosum TaxID=879819 RepID=A0A0J0XNG4_9TREE|nr:uncharacterized protein CC85DRAFT_328069 [Cutaneotrichosporon oleaginosum]KLT42665.1 hypothetical protein CC85DRAFT_328069 [Cutaneotrichosporon oleaginosum]TXT05219.1 hypothetical protein COLE_06539 [Cutaneotrichosporon oleaginosum]